MRDFYCPWNPKQRAPALRIERQSAACRVLGLPYSTPRAQVRAAARTAPATVVATIDHEVAKSEALLAKAYEGLPDDYVQPPNDMYRQIIADTVSEHFAFWGGRGGGKTRGLADAVIELASLGKERVCGAREHMTRIKQSSKEALEGAIKRSPWANDWTILEFELRNERTGSEVFFVGLNGGAEGPEGVAKALEGVTVLWLDEAQTVTQRSLDVVLPTLRADGSKCLWSWNPGQDTTAIDLLFRGAERPERCRVFSVMFFDNPYFYCSNLPGKQRSDLRMKDSGSYRNIWLGAKLLITDATVFLDLFLDEHLEQSDIERFGEPLCGMDFSNGGADPHAVVKAWKLPAAVCQSYAELRRFEKPIINVAAEAVAPGTVAQSQLYSVVNEAGIFGDELHCDSANPACIDALQDSGINAYPVEKGRVLGSINELRSHVIVVSPNAPVTGQELRNLRYATDRNTGQIKVGDNMKVVGQRHCVDALRYSILPVAYPKRATVTMYHNGRRVS